MAPFNDNEVAGTSRLPRGWLDEAGSESEPLGHYLVAIGGAEPGQRVEIHETPVTIGRSPQQTLVFADDPNVSRRHVRLSVVDDRVVAEDLGSTNGTFVDGERLTQPVRLREGNVLHVGSQRLKYERRSRRDVARSEELNREMRKASNYVLSLLPAPLDSGTVRAEWRFVPCAQLGGDGFGYYWLDPSTFVFYLIDVAGHGVGAAMHSVTVLNVLRQRALPGVDFQSPADVLASLNTRFQMDDHNGLYVTIWYGVYRPGNRELTYGSAGHHAAYLVPPDKQEAHPLGMSALMIGAMPDHTYKIQQTTVPPGSTLYLFSDGVFEIVTKEQRKWALSDFLPILVAPTHAQTPESERIYQAVTEIARPGPLDDDFSLLVVSFP
jgi:serine phosphatase RsbU (regulator of sigma subunit)